MRGSADETERVAYSGPGPVPDCHDCGSENSVLWPIPGHELVVPLCVECRERSEVFKVLEQDDPPCYRGKALAAAVVGMLLGLLLLLLVRVLAP